MDFINSHKTLESFMNQVSDSEDNPSTTGIETTDKSNKYKEDFLSDSQGDPLSELLAKNRFYKKIEDEANGNVDYKKLNKLLDFTGSDKLAKETSGTSLGHLINDVEWNTFKDIEGMETTEPAKRDHSLEDNVKWDFFEETKQVPEKKVVETNEIISEDFWRKPQIINPETTTLSALQKEYRGVQRLEYSKEISGDLDKNPHKEEDRNFGLKLFRIEETEKSHLREMKEIMADLENFGEHTTVEGSGVARQPNVTVEEIKEVDVKETSSIFCEYIAPNLSTKEKISRLIESLLINCKILNFKSIEEGIELLRQEMMTQEDIIKEYQKDNVLLRERLKNQQIELQVQQKSQASQISQLNRNITQFKNELEMRPRSSQECETCVSLQGENNKMKTELIETKKTTDEMEKRCSKLHQSLEVLQTENQSLNDSNLTNLRINSQTQQLKTALENSLNQNTNLTNDLQNKLEQKTKQLSSTRRKMEAAETTIESLRRRIITMENEVKPRSDSQIPKTSQSTKLGNNKQIDHLRTVGSRFCAYIKKMKDDFSTIQTCVDSLRSEINLFEKKAINGQVCRNLKEIQTQLNWRVGKITQLFHQCESVGGDGKDNVLEGSGTEGSYQITKALDDIRGTQDKVLEKLSTQVEEMKVTNVVESQQATIDFLNKKLTEKQQICDQVVTLRQSEVKLLKEIEKLEVSLVSARRTQEPASREFEGLMNRLEELETKYNRAVAESNKLTSNLPLVDDEWNEQSKWSALVEEKDEKINYLKNHLSQIYEILKYISKQGIDISIPQQFSDYLS